MITDEELMIKIEKVSTEFRGQLNDLNEAIGMLVAGRLYGWKVIRLVHSKRMWSVACKLFGDLKEILPERGILAHKSIGLMIFDKAGDYWDFINGVVRRDDLPLHERKKAV